MNYQDHYKFFIELFSAVKNNAIDVEGLASKVYVSSASDTLELQHSPDSEKLLRLHALNNAFKEIITA